MATWIVGGVLAVIVGAVVFKMVRDRRAGKGGCGCNCAGCSGCSGHCAGGCPMHTDTAGKDEN